ncbi:MAG: YidC/Oxa1 family insertase periplasmic-domain containing protein [Candidatus Omnitrophica bacterium]|jgi:YidC/Oxa1 family membrane protein insertase|nr:YidC/Oxa1 family insertase periplasmic-domain containing protein [Candidatus Omnitrophota bacterium]
MEKRLFLVFFIILAFSLIWGQIVTKYLPQQPAGQLDKNKYPSSEAIEESSAKEPKETLPEDNIENTNLPQVSIGNFIITYSLQGGYIKNIAYKTTDNILPFSDIGFLDCQKDQYFQASFIKEALIFQGLNGVKKEFVFQENTLEIKQTPLPTCPVLLFSNYLHSNGLEQKYQDIFYAQNSNIQHYPLQKLKEQSLAGIDFIGGRNRYYCLSLLPDNYKVDIIRAKNSAQVYLSPSSVIRFYIGPQIEAELKAHNLQSIVNYGFFDSIAKVMIKLLYFLYSLTKNWGLSIIIFAVFIYFVLHPFTAKSTKAMRKMQEIQPQMEELKKKHQDSPQKLQKETIELYRQHKINPLGGCLPLFLQLPIFISLYQILYRLVELKGANFLWIRDLSSPDHLFKLPFPSPLDYFNLLPILLMIVGLIQQKVTTSAHMSADQRRMGLFFGVFLGVIFYNFPSALVLYWFVQNLLTFFYQLRLAKTSR